MRVLIATTASADDRKPVVAARALRALGSEPILATDQFRGQAAWTRALVGRARCPHPNAGVEQYAAAIRNRAAEHGCGVVLPMNGYTTGALVHGREALGNEIRTALPSAESLEITKDKLRTAELTATLDIPTPRTWRIDVRPPPADEVIEGLLRQVDYPCVVKLRRGAGAIGLGLPENPDELRAVLAARRASTDSSDLVHDRECLLVQERVSGESRDVGMVCCRGEVRGFVVSRRVRTHPPAAGFGTVVETIHDQQLVEDARRIAEALRWHGPIQVEFMVDPRSRRRWLIELNGRFWGTMGAAVAAGLNVPEMVCRLALDGDVDPVAEPPAGLRYRNPFPFAALALLQRRRPGSSRWDTLRDYLGPDRRAQSDLHWRDPTPIAAELLDMVRRAWGRRSLRPGSRE